jgi:hypothetical protein
VPARAGGLYRTTLVPVYAKFLGSGNCPAVRASSYTFEQMYLYSPRAPYSGPGKLALMLQVKGLKDANGSPVTGRLTIGFRRRGSRFCRRASARWARTAHSRRNRPTSST